MENKNFTANQKMRMEFIYSLIKEELTKGEEINEWLVFMQGGETPTKKMCGHAWDEECECSWKINFR